MAKETLKRSQVYPGPIVDGRPLAAGPWSRLGRRLGSLLTSADTRAEAQLEAALLGHRRGVSRTNTVAVGSPRGGVGKTTCTFVLGQLIASRLALRVVAVDADPDFGNLAQLVPTAACAGRDLGHVLADMDRIESAAALRPYVTALPSGLHLVAAPEDPYVMAEMTPEAYGQLISFLSLFYDVVLLDLATGLSSPVARLALGRSDQKVLVTGPEYVTAQSVLDSLSDLGGPGQAVTVVLNRAAGKAAAIERELHRRGVERQVTVPDDARLHAMLEAGRYQLGELGYATRMPLKTAGLTLARALV